MEQEKEIKIVELLAHTLFVEGLSSGGDASTWRTDGEIREEYRKHAYEIMEVLFEKGVRLSLSSAKKADEAIEGIITVPAVRAYELAEVESGSSGSVTSV